MRPGEEVRGYWRRLHNEELYDLYFSPNIIKVIRSIRLRCAGHVARMGEKRNEHRFWGRERVGKRPVGRLRNR